MALIFCDGFDHYDNVDLLKKWSECYSTPLSVGDPSQLIDTAYACPPGGQGLRVFGDSNRRVRKNLPSTYATFVFGCNFMMSGTVNGGGGYFVSFEDTTNEQCSLRVSSSGQIIVSRNGTTLATSLNTLSANTWYHIEAKITIHNSTGAYEVRVNGSATGWIGAATNANTRGTGTNNYINSFALRSANGAATFDDVYLLDTSGAVANDFIGPQKIMTIRPAGAGHYAQWTGNYASNFANVNEAIADGDGSFNMSSTANQIDTFAMTDVPTGTVSAIQHVIEARRDAGAARTLRAKTRISGSDYDGTSVVLSTSHLFYTDPVSISPATSSAWTDSEINGAEFGYELVS